MTVFNLAEQFSKQLKIAKSNYLISKKLGLSEFDEFLSDLSEVNLDFLQNDNEKKAFWINVYNGFTNYLIIRQKLKSQMKEEPGFFRNHRLEVGGYALSLDDIEHGLLRRNARSHLSAEDDKLDLQVDQLDYRIHFALNCGAVSCPAIAFYTAKEVHHELTMAESIFSENEFLVDHKNKVIKCSELFVWYKQDFVDVYLNDAKFVDYMVETVPYNWSIA